MVGLIIFVLVVLGFEISAALGSNDSRDGQDWLLHEEA